MIMDAIRHENQTSEDQDKFLNYENKSVDAWIDEMKKPNVWGRDLLMFWMLYSSFVWNVYCEWYAFHILFTSLTRVGTSKYICTIYCTKLLAHTHHFLSLCPFLCLNVLCIYMQIHVSTFSSRSLSLARAFSLSLFPFLICFSRSLLLFFWNAHTHGTGDDTCIEYFARGLKVVIHVSRIQGSEHVVMEFPNFMDRFFSKRVMWLHAFAFGMYAFVWLDQRSKDIERLCACGFLISPHTKCPLHSKRRLRRNDL